ncbi:MAG TPA: hypothetical protein GX707_09785 [Epulopiscium sp.]|nr:hypothetical protein [Candidatus Epulonipiscium sp.]
MILVIAYLLVFSFVLEVCNKRYYKLKVGVIVLSRKNMIQTTLCIPSLIRYILKGPKGEFEKDGDRFFNLLKPGVEYSTNTNSFVRKGLRTKLGKDKIKEERIKDMYVFLPSILIGNFEGFFTKKYYQRKPYYKITFIK